MEQLKLQGLKIYDPRYEARTFELSNGITWKNSEENVLFFETDNYSYYTDADWVKRLLEVLIEQASTFMIGLRVYPIELKNPLGWLSNLHVSNKQLDGVFSREKMEDAMDFFDKIADYGVWDFYGIGLESQKVERLKKIPDALADCKRYSFFVEIDLDGMLMGYIHYIQ